MFSRGLFESEGGTEGGRRVPEQNYNWHNRQCKTHNQVSAQTKRLRRQGGEKDHGHAALSKAPLAEEEDAVTDALQRLKS